MPIPIVGALAGITRIGTLLGAVGRAGKFSAKSLQLGESKTTHFLSGKANNYILQNRKEMERLVNNIANDVIINTQQQLKVDDINFTGGLSSSIHTDEFKGMKTVDIDSPYARVVEFGLLPGTKVNFDALRNWVEGKLKITDEEELRVVTLKIMNKIYSGGIKPTRFFKKAIKALIAQRGIVKSTSPRRRLSGFERSLNKGVRMSRKISRTVRRVQKHIRKFEKAKSMMK